MLPDRHFDIAVVCTIPVAILYTHEVRTIALWAVTSGLVSAAIDLDVYAMVFAGSFKNARLKPFRNFINIYKKFNVFMETIEQTGILKKAMVTHFALAGLFCLASWLLAPAFLVPVIVAGVSHLLSDTPHIKKILLH